MESSSQIEETKEQVEAPLEEVKQIPDEGSGGMEFTESVSSVVTRSSAKSDRDFSS